MDVVAARGSGEAGGGGGSSNSGGEEENNKSFGGNRWPRQETLALLKIRSDMDQIFRDSSLKGPLWEKISMKLAELGYDRSAKKCKEKFENVFKYHKRTKDGRIGKSEGKTYRFFDQLEAFDHHHNTNNNNNPPTTNSSAYMISTSTVPSNPISYVTPNSEHDHTNTNAPNPSVMPTSNGPTVCFYPPVSINNPSPHVINPIANNLFSSSTSSSTASDDEFTRRAKRKRKLKVFFKRLTKEVIEKQEELQNKFLETIDRRENERVTREEAWRIQEMERSNREHEILIQERSNAAAKEAVVTTFLHKISSQQPQPQPRPPCATNAAREKTNSHEQQLHQWPVPPTVRPIVLPPPPAGIFDWVSHDPSVLKRQKENKAVKNNDNNNNAALISPSRWPKVEVEALIRLRTDLDMKYQDNGEKGPLWEEISSAMRNIGYNRNGKRCKEKWENINKYFKKVKESSKKRPEDSKTCPYFHQLNAIYATKKNKVNNNSGTNGVINMKSLMVEPEQQWPPPPPVPQQDNHMQSVIMDQLKGINNSQDDDDDDNNDDEGGFDSGDEEGAGGGGVYEFVANNNKPISMV